MLDDSSALVAELRDRQRVLVTALEAIDKIPIDSPEFDAALSGVTDRVRAVVDCRNELPLREHQAQCDRYGLRIRLAGIATVVMAIAIGGAVLLGWVNPWLVLPALATLLIGGWLAVSAAGDRERLGTGASPRDRCVGALLALLIGPLIFASGLVSAWFLVAVVAVTAVAIAYGLGALTRDSSTGGGS